MYVKPGKLTVTVWQDCAVEWRTADTLADNILRKIPDYLPETVNHAVRDALVAYALENYEKVSDICSKEIVVSGRNGLVSFEHVYIICFEAYNSYVLF